MCDMHQQQLAEIMHSFETGDRILCVNAVSLIGVNRQEVGLLTRRSRCDCGASSLEATSDIPRYDSRSVHIQFPLNTIIYHDFNNGTNKVMSVFRLWT